MNLNKYSQSSEGYSLIFCRTPLQSMIANDIIRKMGDKCVLIYYPTTDSIKHSYYFEKIEAKEKHFLPWQPIKWSDTLTGFWAWWRIPVSIRAKKFSNLYISSVGDIPFSLFCGKNVSAKINTFDDGNFNINKEEFLRWINEEPASYLIIKKIMGGINNKDLFKRIFCHYTIYSKKMLPWMRCRIDEIGLFRSDSCKIESSRNKKKIRILLGSWFMDKRLNDMHDNLCKSTCFDLFLSHPGSKLNTRVGAVLGNSLCIDDLKFLVAEDVVTKLVDAGWRPVVYGFNSSALINLKGIASVISINIDDSFSGFADDLRKMGIKVLDCRE